MRKLLTLTAISLLICFGAIAQISDPATATKQQVPKKVQTTVLYSGPAYLGTEIPAGVNKVTTIVNSSLAASFPVKVNTGDPLKDEEMYRQAKEQWIRQNPGKYEELVKQSQIKK